MIVSLHTPKAGGSSFKVLLQNHFKTQFKSDYSDTPFNTEKSLRQLDAIKFDKKFRLYKKSLYQLKGVECIHGHFLPYKYNSLFGNKNVNFITWLRDPIERMASHYYYWQRAYDKNKSLNFHKQVVEQKWSLEKFCFSEEVRNFYDQFLWKCPIDNFSFVGILEHYSEDCKYFAKIFLDKSEIEVPNKNANPNKMIYFTDHKIVNELKEFHSIDYEIYNTALEMRKIRINDKP